MRIMLDTGTKDRPPRCGVAAAGGGGGPSWQSEREAAEGADVETEDGWAGVEAMGWVPCAVEELLARDGS